MIAAIEERLKILDTQISRLEKKIASRGENTIKVYDVHGYKRFYEKAKDGRRRYLGSKEKDTIKCLAQKEYETLLLRVLKSENERLASSLQLLMQDKSGIDANSVLLFVDSELREYITPDIATDDGYAQKWLSERYRCAQKTDNHIYTTLRNDKVRSKSEVIIADRLFAAGIPYRYEQRLELFDEYGNTLTYYPDFVVLNKRTRQKYYWEHIGRLGDQDYCSDNLSKLEYYAENGIILGKNLILTFESQKKPLYTPLVDMLIKQYLK